MSTTLQFKTNIKCGGCVAAVTPHLNQLPQIEQWEVDLQDPNRILSVHTKELSAQQIIQTLQKAGYQAELLG